MHVLRVSLLVAVIFVASSGAILKKDFHHKDDDHDNKGFGLALKASALKYAAGAALKKAAVIGGFKAIGKAKDDFFDGIKQAKLNLLKKIATVKLAKLAALKAGKLAFLKTLAVAKLAPLIAEKIKADHLKVDDKKTGNFLLDGIVGLVGKGGKDNPIGSLLGDIVLGGILGGGKGPKFDFGKILGGIGGGLGLGGFGGGLGFGGLPPLGGLGGLGGLGAIGPIGGGPVGPIGPIGGGPIQLEPLPGKPEINIQTYQVNPPPHVIETYEPPHIIETYEPPHHIESYGPPELLPSYGPPPPSHPTYIKPATSYGPPPPSGPY